MEFLWLDILTISYNIHFVAYSFDKKCDPTYSNFNLEGHLIKLPKCLSHIIISRRGNIERPLAQDL
jgi:hypothetical protein